MFFKIFQGFSEIWDPEIEENLVNMAMLSRSWAVLGDFGCKSSCLWRSLKQDGANEATRSATMSHQRLPDGRVALGFTLNDTLLGPTFYNYSLLEMKTSSS